MSSGRYAPMNERLFLLAMYGLGFVGLAGLSTIWIRAWQFLRRTLPALWSRGRGHQVVAFLGIAIFAYPLWLWAFALRRVFRCLTEPSCGPNLAAGWIALAIFGGAYLLLEIILFSIRRFSRVA